MSEILVRDPFEIVGKIPKGISYQWHAESVMGVENRGVLRVARAAGWTFVPPQRHPKMHRVKNAIRVGACVLMQRRTVSVRADRQREERAALAMFRESPLAPDRYKDNDKWRAFEACVSAAPSYTGEDIKAAAHVLPVVDGRRYCYVTIPVAIDDKEIETALCLKLEPTEYVRRRLVMDEEVVLVHRNSWTVNNECLFARADLMARIIKTESGL